MGLDSFKSEDTSTSNSSPDVDAEATSELAEYVAILVDSEGTINSGAQKRQRYDIGFQINNNIQVSQTFKPTVASLIDSEGNINLRAKSNERYDLGYTIGSSLRVGQSFSELQPFQRFHTMLAVFCDSVGVEHKYNVFKREEYVQYRWTVNKLDDVYTVLSAIQPYMILKNEQALIFMNEVYPMMKEGIHKRKEGFLKIMEESDKMAELRQNNGNRKYNTQYFKEQEGW